jgi:hypothetical protein
MHAQCKSPILLKVFRRSFVEDSLLAILLTVGNVWLLRELAVLPYGNHFSSIEGAFIGFARGLVEQGFLVRWWPSWHGGLPIEHVYVPVYHLTVAAFQMISKLSTG